MSRSVFGYVVAGSVAGAALLLIGVVTWVQGSWSERWGEHAELKIFAEHLRKIPMQIGDWSGKKTAEPSKQIQQVAGNVGTLSAEFRNQYNPDQWVKVDLVCGRLQDVFYHTPDRCYPAAGFSAGGSPVRQVFDLPSGEAQFFTSTFQKHESAGSQNLRIYWGWCADGPWVAPDQEKWTFAGRKALYKLYIATEATGEQTSEHNPASDFIKVFVPELQKALKTSFEPAKGANKMAKPELTKK